MQNSGSFSDRVERLIRKRLRAVGKLANAVAQPRGPVRSESIHDLRIATRRAQSALELGRDWLPRGRRKKMNRLVRGIRRAFGKTRDWDVLLEQLSDQDVPLARKPRTKLRRLVRKLRTDAIHRAGGKVRANQLPKFSALRLSVVNSLARQTGSTVASLPDLVNQTLTRQRQALRRHIPQRNPGFRQLHRLRITCRQTRYDLESLLELGASRDLRPCIELLVEMQRRLGHAIDASNVLQRLDKLVPQVLRARRLTAWQRFLRGERRRVDRRATRDHQEFRARLKQLRRQLRDLATNPGAPS